MHKKRRRLRKTVKKTIRILLIIFIVVLTGLSYSLVTDADDYSSNDYPAYQNTVSIDTQSNGKLSLSVTADEHILPENTNISLKEITDTASDVYKNIETSLEDDASSNNDLLSGVLLYDLSFTDTDSHEIPSINDHDIHVYGSYEKHADPLTENDNESVSVKLISKDNAYTVTDLSKDNYSSVDTDENNAVENMSMTIHGSTYYALIWHKKPEITVHAVDENNTEFIPSNTVQISEDTYINDFTPSVGGYTLTSITGNNTDITKVKAENGKLYFHNGTEWQEASDSNVYFHYVSNKTQQPAEQKTIEETTQPDTEETPEPEAVTDTTHQLTETSDDNKYTVTVSYGDDAGLPEGTSLQVTTIDSDKEEYANAKKAVAASKQVDEDTLGMDALDITLLDSDGTEVEPSESSHIQVSISINDLPDNIDSVEIHHITDEDKPETTEDKASAVAENVDVVNNTANAEFNVNSFSTFTITWSTTDNTIIGGVTLHYVDSNGLELTTATSFSSDELAKKLSESISLSDYGSGKVDGYTYDHAVIGARTGTDAKTVTQIKVDQNGRAYQLSYKTSDDAEWTIYKNARTGSETNNADVYLIYTNDFVAPITVHYVDNNGNPITDANGNKITKVVDVAKLNSPNNGTDIADSKGPFVINISGYKFNSSSVNAGGSPSTSSSFTYIGTTDNISSLNFYRNTTNGNSSRPATNDVKTVIGNIYGRFFRFIKYDSTTKHILFARGDRTFYYAVGADVGIYLTYSADNISATVHHVDENGNKISEDTTVNNIATSTGGSKKFDPDANKTSLAGYSLKESHAGSLTGSTLTEVDYTYGSSKATWTSTIKNGDSSTDINGAVNEFWLVYKADQTQPVTVHYVDDSHNLISDVESKTINVGNGQTLTPSDADIQKDISGYSYSGTAYYGASTIFTSLKYSYDGTNWSSTYSTDSVNDSSTGSLVTDIYLVYNTANTKAITVHYVDTDNSAIKQPTVITLHDTDSEADRMLEQAELAVDINNYQPAGMSIKLDGSTDTYVASVAYSYSDSKWTGTYSDGSNTGDASSISDLYLHYELKPLTIAVRYIDSDGNVIYTYRPTRTTSAGNSTVTLSDDDIVHNLRGYDFAKKGYFFDGDTQVDFDYSSQDSYDLTITYSHAKTSDGSGGTWTSTYKTTDDGSAVQSSSVISTIYLNFTNRPRFAVTVHHVDDTGAAIADDTTNYVYSGGSENNQTLVDSGLSSEASSRQLSLTKVPANYTFDHVYFKNGSGESSTDTTFKSLKYAYTAPANEGESGTWTSQYSTDGTNYTSNNTDPTVSEVWAVYNRKNHQDVSIHYVDAGGNTVKDDTIASIYNGGSIDLANADYASAVAGYSITSGYFKADGSTQTPFTSVTYNYGDNKWSTTYKTENSESGTATDNPITEVWLVYSAGTSFNAYYVYMNPSTNKPEGTNYTTKKDDGSFTTTQTFTVSPSDGNRSLIYDPVNSASTGLIKTDVKATDNQTNLSYMITRLGSPTGPRVTSVSVDENGNAYYHTSSTGTMAFESADTWTLSPGTGRTFTLNRDSNGNLTLLDNLMGTINLSYTDDSKEIATATYDGDKISTKYTVTARTLSGGTETYELSYEDYLPSNSKEIYFVYTNAQSKVYLIDDEKYSGFLLADIDDRESLNADPNSITYTWYRVTENASTNDKTTEEVIRSQAGEHGHWNLAYNASARTALDVEADMGSNVWTKANNIYYYVQVNYTEGGEKKTLTSDELKIPYYGRLENGSFEDPSRGKQYSNSEYETSGGVWQTTGLGSESLKSGGRTGLDIEIVSAVPGNTNDNASNYNHYSLVHDYHWQASEEEKSNTTGSWAVEGQNFAELNCEAAGALYQDVITHPNEELSYKFSHRARGGSEADNLGYKYDTMYLVIMPTNLAMISGANNSELTTQEDLQNFIQAHGGFDSSVATHEVDEVTYRNEQQGILIRKVSSDEVDWHHINVTDGYTAKGGLTRFFFAAASTASDAGRSQANPGLAWAKVPTEGNFLDDVAFTQELTVPEGFTMTVAKTFTGLTQEQIASLASNNNENPFTLTINNSYSQGGTTVTNSDRIGLSGALLQFTAADAGNGNYTFTPTAVLPNGTDLLTDDNSTGVARVNNDGTVTMRWRFVNQNLDSSYSDAEYTYTVTEGNDKVNGYSLTSNVTDTATTNGNTSNGSVNSMIIHQGTIGTFNFDNNYRDNSSSDQPRIIVSKTFTGVTKTTVVNDLLGNNYQIRVTRTADQNGKAISTARQTTETLNGANALSTTENADGSVTLLWDITGWSKGTYTVEESGYTPTAADNRLKKITINESEITIPVDGSSITKTGISVSADDPNSLTFTNAKTLPESGGMLSETNTLDEGTNIIIGKYTLGSGEDAQTKYIIWTSETLSATTSEAIISKINTIWTGSGDTATINNTDFRSGADPGELPIKRDASYTYGSMTYSSSDRNLTISSNEEGSLTWNGLYSAHYHIASDPNGTETYVKPDIRIMNIYNPILKIEKLDSKTGDTLKGAKFRLYKLGTGNTKLYYHSSNNENTVPDLTTGWDSSTDNAKEFTTGDDGIVEIGALGKADTGQTDTYYLEEYEAPDGYNKVPDIQFTINDEGVVKIGTDVNSDVADVYFPNPYYIVRIKDTPGTVLPGTGGIGTYIFYIAGGLIVVIAVLLLVKRKNKKE